MSAIFRLAGPAALALALAGGGALVQEALAQGNGPGNGPGNGLGMMGPAGSAKAGPVTDTNTGTNTGTNAGPASGQAPETAPVGWGRGYGPGSWMAAGGYGPGPWAMGSGWLGPQMMGRFGPGPWITGGAGTAPWMMGPWMMGPWMMGPWTVGPGMTGPGAMGPGGMGPWMAGWDGYGSCAGWGPGQQAGLNLDVAEVKAGMQRWLAATRNPHIKLGGVSAKNSETITADIVTTDNGGLVQRYDIDRRTGFVAPAEE